MRDFSLIIILLFSLILQSHEVTYSQTALQYYNFGMELFNQPYFDKEGASEAVKLFNEVIKQDSTFLEAYFRIGSLYSNPDRMIYDKEKAEMYFNKTAELMKNGYTTRTEYPSAREILRDIAFSYEYYFSSNDEANYEKAIEYYKKSLSVPFDSTKDTSYLDSDKSIIEDISKCYENLGDLKKDKDLFQSAIYYYQKAIDNFLSYTSDSSLIQILNYKINLVNRILEAQNWKVFRINEHFVNKELISSDNSIYFFDSNSVEFNKNILRLWIRGLKIDKEELKDSDAYDYQGLWEIDIKTKKVRTLSIVVFNKKNKIIDSITFDNPKWDYFPPGSITDSIMKYFNSKKTK